MGVHRTGKDHQQRQRVLRGRARRGRCTGQLHGDRDAHQGAYPVEADVERLARHGIKSSVGAFANGQIPLRHDPEPLAEVILSLIDSEWLPGDGLLLSEMQQVRDLREAVVGYWS